MSTTPAGGAATVMHYADASDSPAWTGTGSSWTVLATGLDGRLSVTATSSTGTLAASVSELQVTDLHGDTVATAAVPATGSVTALDAATTAYDEFGATIAGTTGQGAYGWLAAQRRATSGDVVLMGARLYNPATGRFLQVDPVPGGSAGPYLYPTDPILGYDLDGKKWNWSKFRKGMRALGAFLYRNRDDLASAASYGACFVGPVTCLVASLLAVAADWDKNGRPAGWRAGIDPALALFGLKTGILAKIAKGRNTSKLMQIGRGEEAFWNVFINLPALLPIAVRHQERRRN